MVIRGGALPFTATVIHPTQTTDRAGNTQDVYGVTGTSISCWFEQSSRSELGDLRDASSTQWLLVTTPDVAINAHDRVLFDGVVYEVDGDPATRNTFEGPHHIEATLTLVGS